jgi:hypothetical protein
MPEFDKCECSRCGLPNDNKGEYSNTFYIALKNVVEDDMKHYSVCLPCAIEIFYEAQKIREEVESA